MSEIPFVHTENNGREELTLFLGDTQKHLVSTDPAYREVKKALFNKATAEEILEILKPKMPVAQPVATNSYMDDCKFPGSLAITVKSGKFYCADQEIEECLADELVKLTDNGFPTTGMINFIERLYDSAINPNGKRVSARVRQELLAFIKRNGIVIDSNGDLIAYKAVKEDYFDKYTGKTFENKPGTRVWMDFGTVNDNKNVGCSKGLHAGSLDYVANFGYGNDRVVIVRIDPADVVSVPSDCAFQKLRTCAYTVIGDYQGELKFTSYEATDDASSMYKIDWEDDDFDDGDDDGWDDLDDQDDWDDDDDDPSPTAGKTFDEDQFDPGDVHTSFSNRVNTICEAVKGRFFSTN